MAAYVVTFEHELNVAIAVRPIIRMPQNASARMSKLNIVMAYIVMAYIVMANHSDTSKCIGAHVETHVYTHAYTHVYAYIYTHACAFTPSHMSIHVPTHISIHAARHIPIVCAHVHTHGYRGRYEVMAY